MKLDEMMEENLDLICKLDLKYETCNCLMESKQSL